MQRRWLHLPPASIESLSMGQVGSKLQRIYAQHSYDVENAEALARLANLIERIVNLPTGDKVRQFLGRHHERNNHS
jgi:hypothetical protein